MVAVAVPIPMYNYLISRRRGAIGFKLYKIWLILFLHWSQRDAFFIMGKMFGSLETSIFYSVLGVWKLELQPVRPSRICLRHSIPLTHYASTMQMFFSPPSNKIPHSFDFHALEIDTCQPACSSF